MFKAIKLLKRKRFENPIIHDEEGKSVANNQEKYNIINQHFKTHFQKEDAVPIERFVGPARPLNCPVTSKEVTDASNKASDGKAPDKFNMPAELIKYAPESIHTEIARLINNMFEKHIDTDTGSGILLPLPKPPPKTKGPVKNLRPIILLPILRKVMSRIALARTSSDMNKFLPQSQSAYRSNRSTTDIIWAYRWILAKVQEYNITIYVSGIDMSSAFDTIKRDEILKLAESILQEDETRILRVLLSNTTLEVRVEGAITQPFTSNIGSPQGDSISGPIFTVYFEHALRQLRSEVLIQHEREHDYFIEQNLSALPDEMTYADDHDTITDSIEKRDRIMNIIAASLEHHNLQVNEDKTEHITLKRGNRDTELWRNVRKLGSLLGDKEDIARRKQLSCAAMKDTNKLWRKKNLTRISKRIELYKALVKSVLTYNASTWGLTKDDENRLDSFHRQQLRRVIGVVYPHRISCKKLYKVTKSTPLSVQITKMRWKMFGHCLRMDENTPARRAMTYYFQPTNETKFKGQKRATIITTLNRDIRRTKDKFAATFGLSIISTTLSLRNTRIKANNRIMWRKYVKMITDAAYSDRAIRLNRLSL